MTLGEKLKSRGCGPGWYIYNQPYDHMVIRGPYKYGETAAAVREEIEKDLSDERAEQWNLGIVELD